MIGGIVRRLWPRTGGWLPVMMLTCGVLASCSSEGESTVPLSNDKYPLRLTAEVAQPQTRTGGKDAWTGGEGIRVSLEGVLDNKTCIVGAPGNANPKDADNVPYWEDTSEAHVSVWTLNIGSETNISDQSGGYTAFDVLYASAIGRYDQAINLRFIHRMAKIEVIFKVGEGITEEELESATVTIFGDPLTHSTAGLVSPGDQSDGEIKSYYGAATKKYEVLVPSQDMTGKSLIRASTGSGDFTYIPETETANRFGFFGGKRYAYVITVRTNGVKVTAAGGGTRNTSGSENVGVTVTYDNTETELKIGDHYYPNGTWRDGGLYKLYADGTMEWAETKPQPENGKNIVIIVFHADHRENDTPDYSATGIGQQKCYGYTVTLQDAINGYYQWGVYGTELGCCLTDGSGKKQDNHSVPDIDWNGYAWTQKIIAAAGDKNKLNATEGPGYPTTYHAAMDYTCEAPSPANGTGWFLSSIGQMQSVYQNRVSLFEGKTVVSGLKSDWYWSSSEFHNRPARYTLYVCVFNGLADSNPKDNSDSFMRPVLAF